MKNQDLGSKKMNNKQSNNDDLLGVTMQNHTGSLMKSEIEVDKNGVRKVVERARNTNHDKENHEVSTDKNLSTKPSTASEAIGKKMVENKDKNFDITPNRYPNSSPENKENRGNL
ncbi:hypothetical protein [Flavobacterium sp.]|uniref:hypothetical protein n=1 Tax=Flavobacterium sp. TaxID=239 RepID=UPI0037525DAB